MPLLLLSLLLLLPPLLWRRWRLLLLLLLLLLPPPLPVPSLPPPPTTTISTTTITTTTTTTTSAVFVSIIIIIIIAIMMMRMMSDAMKGVLPSAPQHVLPWEGPAHWMSLAPPSWTTTNWPWPSGSVTWRRWPSTCRAAACRATLSWSRRATLTWAGTRWRGRGSSTSWDSVFGSMVRICCCAVQCQFCL